MNAAVEYRPIEGFPGYRVGADGSVWSCLVVCNRPGKMTDSWHRLTPVVNGKYGHLKVTLRKDRRSFKRYVHRLVLEAFVGPCPVGMEACHDPDPDPANNRLENLRWDTHQSNVDDTGEHGNRYQGDRHHYSVLSEKDVRLAFELFNEIPNCTYRDLALLFNVSRTAIWAALTGLNWSWLGLTTNRGSRRGGRRVARLTPDHRQEALNG